MDYNRNNNQQLQTASVIDHNVKQPVPISSAPKRISQIQFSTLTSGDIQKFSEIEVSSRELFQMPTRAPAPYGCMDSRLGISDKRSICQTCNKKLIDCAGHFGYIPLELPVFHAGYFKHTLILMQCICKQCSRILLPLDERQAYIKRLRNPNIDAFGRGNLFKKIVTLCKRNTVCPHCHYSNGVVKKISGCVFKIIHEKFRAKNVAFDVNNKGDEMDGSVSEVDGVDVENVIRRNSPLSNGGTTSYAATILSTPTITHQKRQLREIIDVHPELRSYLTKSQEVLTPLKCYEALTQVTEEDMALLWMENSFGNAPETLIIWNVPVPPVPIRPSVPMDSGDGSTEDDITMKLQEIIDVNNALKVALTNGGTMKMVIEDWEFLQIQCAQLINGETPGIPRALLGPKPIRGICQRLKGKQGRFRGNLSGKRVDFSARTVISPDPNLAVEQVGVPTAVAIIMTYPERVNQYNIERLRQCVLNGPTKHPGANIIRTENGFVKSLVYADREKSARFLRIGDIVERHMQDGDIVLFNRQPSLHKSSIMSHVAKVMPWCTFRFNECACTPYNADFDGDEMNMHLPQTEEARAEASELMNVAHNLVTARNGEPLVAATQDFITAAYLITQKDVFFDRAAFCKVVGYLADASEEIDMPQPAIYRPIALWTGKQVFSVLVNPNKRTQCLINLESQEKFYTKGKQFCVQDGYVTFHQGELVSGNLGKKTLGDSSKKSMFFVLIRDYGPREATRCMGRLAKLTARYLCDRGFSIGIEDVTPTTNMTNLKTRIMNEGQDEAKEQIASYNKGTIKLKPGCNALQSLESEVNGILGRIREKCGQEAMNTLHHRNAPLSMAQCGSKGSPLNISQMISCLGQQSVGGSRIQDGFANRTLPHFPLGSLLPDAKGFVANSFFSGLTATEFFFHTMGGREGLVDTAVKTAETGYMARRLMKALEDLSMQYDTTVRNSEQMVVQFSYGDDGLNPGVMEAGDRPVDFKRLSTTTCNTHVFLEENGLSSVELRSYMSGRIQHDEFQGLLPQGRMFIDETVAFFEKFAAGLDALEQLEIGGSEVTAAASSAAVAAAAIAAPVKRGRGAAKVSAPAAAAVVVSGSGSVLRNAHAIRTKLQALSAAELLQWQQECLTPSSTAYHEAHCLLRENTLRITRSQLDLILGKALLIYHASFIEPGEAVGAVGAQSLSEPGTQMTLKTFHFAGVASMNVTLGVPRLKEIINASKVISTPIIEAQIVQADSMTTARIVKASIEKTTLGEVCEYICEVYDVNSSYVSIKIDVATVEALHLNVNAVSVRNLLLSGSFVSANPKSAALLRGLKEKHIVPYGNKCQYLKIFPPDAKESTSAAYKSNGIPTSQRMYFTLQSLKIALPSIIVQGIPTVSRAVINEHEALNAQGKKTYYLLVEGYGLSDVMGTPGVDGKETKSNHILEMQNVLGIEAARAMISNEIGYIMRAYGITVDRRHLLLLSDVMSFKGEILGITRFGVAKMRESVLMLASFEKTTDHLFDAAVHYRTDTIVGVSECIIMGIPIPIGTGLFKVLMDNNKKSCKAITNDVTAVESKVEAEGEAEAEENNGKGKGKGRNKNKGKNSKDQDNVPIVFPQSAIQRVRSNLIKRTRLLDSL